MIFIQYDPQTKMYVSRDVDAGLLSQGRTEKEAVLAILDAVESYNIVKKLKGLD